jgi:hypothetical protein
MRIERPKPYGHQAGVKSPRSAKRSYPQMTEIFADEKICVICG